MKIAMLNCLNANDVCSGAGCFKALNEKRAAFEQYSNEDVTVTAFLRCSNCSMKLEEDQGMLEKLERLVNVGTEVVHIGICGYRKKEGRICPFMKEYADWLTGHGIKVEWGTHSFFPKEAFKGE